MVEYKKVRIVGRMCGDYAAFHEASIYCEYVFGHKETLSDIGEKVCEELELEWEEVEKLPLKALEAVIEKIVKEDNGDYCDTEIQNVLAKFEDGKFVEAYYTMS